MTATSAILTDPPDPHPNLAYDHIVDGFAALCDEVLSTN